jgi:hypothetical protein
MANKQTNKERSECCGQGCNNHENRMKQAEDETCSYVTRITIGVVVAIGGIFMLLNSFVFPNL